MSFENNQNDDVSGKEREFETVTFQIEVKRVVQIGNDTDETSVYMDFFGKKQNTDGEILNKEIKLWSTPIVTVDKQSHTAEFGHPLYPMFLISHQIIKNNLYSKSKNVREAAGAFGDVDTKDLDILKPKPFELKIKLRGTSKKKNCIENLTFNLMDFFKRTRDIDTTLFLNKDGPKFIINIKDVTEFSKKKMVPVINEKSDSFQNLNFDVTKEYPISQKTKTLRRGKSPVTRSASVSSTNSNNNNDNISNNKNDDSHFFKTNKKKEERQEGQEEEKKEEKAFLKNQQKKYYKKSKTEPPKYLEETSNQALAYHEIKKSEQMHDIDITNKPKSPDLLFQSTSDQKIPHNKNKINSENPSLKELNTVTYNGSLDENFQPENNSDSNFLKSSHKTEQVFSGNKKNHSPLTRSLSLSKVNYFYHKKQRSKSIGTTSTKLISPEVKFNLTKEDPISDNPANKKMKENDYDEKCNPQDPVVAQILSDPSAQPGSQTEYHGTPLDMSQFEFPAENINITGSFILENKNYSNGISYNPKS